MSDELLKKLLLGEIEVNLITDWLKNDKLLETNNDNFKCDKQEFVIKFIDYLRDSTARYVQAVPNLVIKKDIGNSALGNILHTSTPKRKVNRSLPINETSFEHRKNKNRSFNATCPTLENFITESLLNSSKENLNKKKKKRGRSSNSPSKDSLVNNEKNFNDTSKSCGEKSYDIKNKSFEINNKVSEINHRNFNSEKNLVLNESSENESFDSKNYPKNNYKGWEIKNKNFNIKNASFEAKNSSLEPISVSFEAQKSSLEAWNANEAQNSTCEAQNSTLETQNSTLETRNSTFEARNSSFETRNSIFKAQNSTIETRKSIEARKPNKVQNSAFETQNSSLEAENSSFEARNSIFEARNSVFEARILNFAQNSTFEGRNSNFEARNSTLEARNSTLEARNSAFEARKSNESRNSSFETRNSTLEAQNSVCETRNSNESRKPNEARNSSFEAQNSTFESRNSSFDIKKSTHEIRSSPFSSKNDNRLRLEPKRLSVHKTHESANVSRSRRIKPTILSEKSEKTVIGSNSFTFTQNSEQLDNFSWQRSILKEEKEKIASRTSDSIITVRRNKTKNFTAVSVKLVSKVPILKSLVQVYKTLIDFGYVLNLLTELNFVLTLLLANGEEGNFISNDFEDIFETIHNSVYFAANILLEEVKFLQILNKTTLRLLCENNRILEFVPELQKILSNFINSRPAEITLGVVQNEDLHIATYIPELEGRDYFPNDASFHAFRRQRDAFYDILRTWQQSKGRPGWNFHTALGTKIRALLSMHQHPINYHHLSKLVTKQILASSSYDEELDNSGNLDKDLPNVSSEKLNKLKNRLVTREVETETQFPHRQEFYREFITSAAYINSMFMSHLTDSLGDTILTMEDGFDADRPDSTEITFTDTNYLSFLKSSRLLSKFLGYILSLPYKGDLKDTSVKNLIATRKHILPPIDIEMRLKLSLTTNKILITIPWLIEFLINLDSITLRLPSYENVIKILLSVNLKLKGHFTSASYFLRLNLGRFFQSESFPRNLFYDYLNFDYCDFLILERDFLTEEIGEISEEAFYECIPSLGALKKILSSGQTSVCVRSIRPVTTAVVSVEKVQVERDQKNLEEVFFHGQSESVRRSVNFVSERISSAIVKNLKRTHIENAIEAATDIFLKYLDENQNLKNDNYEIYIKEAMQKAKDISDSSLTDLKTKCKIEALKMTKFKSEKAIPSLLADDMHPQAISVCITVASKKAFDRITSWIETSLNVAHFMDPLTKELGKMDEESKNKNHVYITHYEKLQEHSIVKLLTENKQLIISIHENPSQVTTSEIVNVLTYNKNAVLGRNDINGSLKDTIKNQNVDIAMALIVNRPDFSKEYTPLIVENLEILFNANDRKDRSSKDKSINILNSRNIQFIEESNKNYESWKSYSNILTIFLKKKIISPNTFEDQVLKIFKNSFSEETFDRIARNLRTIVEDSGLANTELLKVTSCLTNFLVSDLD